MVCLQLLLSNDLHGAVDDLVREKALESLDLANDDLNVEAEQNVERRERVRLIPGCRSIRRSHSKWTADRTGRASLRFVFVSLAC